MHMCEYCSAFEVYMTSWVPFFLESWVLQALALEGGLFNGAGCYNVRGKREGSEIVRRISSLHQGPSLAGCMNGGES